MLFAGEERVGGTCWRLAALALLAAWPAGCSATHYVKLRSAPRDPLVEQLKLASRHGPQPSARTMQLLRQYDLDRKLHGEMPQLLEQFQEILDEEPTPEKVYSFAELNYVAGKRIEGKDKGLALDHYGTAVAHAYLYLFDEQYGPWRNPYDPEFRGACDLYNGALESALRILKERGGLLPGRTYSVESASQAWDVQIVIRDSRWEPEDFSDFKFVSDYEVQGLKNQYHTFGLGVPLIAIRERRDGHDPAEEFLPALLSFPATAFLRVVPDDQSPQPGTRTRHVALLELYDPLASTDIFIGDRRVPLESDLSTPLAYYLNDPQLNPNDPRLNLNAIATEGLLRPEATESASGLYMLQPYVPGKIPVLMVHGLWSSPITWMEMFNDLRSEPEIRDRYQFWFYLYPTGQPFWQSATKLRQDLAHARSVLDPQRNEPAFDQMVVVGHSMGGLVAQMQTVSSRDDFWQIVSEKPFQTVKATADVRNRLAATFFFQPNPAVRRLIMIATPHRGSYFANETTRWLAHELIRTRPLPRLAREELLRDNPGVFRQHSIMQVKTSLDSLAPDSPVLPALLKAARPPWVTYHSIVGILPERGWVKSAAGGTDGVVTYESAHLDDAASELKVDADHMSVHRHPLSILEVRRILLDHLRELERFPAEERTASHVAVAEST